MKDNLIKTIQKFLNVGFRYVDLLAFFEKQEELLLRPAILNAFPEKEYSAMWDTIDHIRFDFAFANQERYVIAPHNYSVSKMFDYHLTVRNNCIPFNELTPEQLIALKAKLK